MTTRTHKFDYLILIFAIIFVFLLMIRRFLIWDAMQGPFIDEMLTIFASKRLLTEGIYSPNSAPIGYEVSVSSGLLSTLPGGFGWLTNGNLMGSRSAFFVYHLTLWISLLIIYFRKVVSLDYKITGLLLSTVVLLTANTLPYIHALSIYSLGEWPGVILLGIGYIIFSKNPNLGSFIFGLVVWHTKFIYLPFTIIPILFNPFSEKRATLKEILLRLSLILLPGFLLWILIWIMTGNSGLLLYFKKQISISIGVWNDVAVPQEKNNGTYNSLNLFKRLQTLSWSYYSVSEKFKILFLSIGGIVLSSGLTYRFRTKFNLRMFYLSVSLLLSAFTIWFFFFHSEMWIRHFFPSLAFSFGLILHHLFIYLKNKSPKVTQTVFLILFTLLTLKEINRKSEWNTFVKPDSYLNRYSLRCKSDNPKSINWESFLAICIK